MVAVLELDIFELDMLCDACDSYIEDVSDNKAAYPVGTMERAEMVREKLRMASHKSVRNTADAKLNRPI